jgi:hypothetical protein
MLRENCGLVRSLLVRWNSSSQSSIRRLPRASLPQQREKTLNTGANRQGLDDQPPSDNDHQMQANLSTLAALAARTPHRGKHEPYQTPLSLPAYRPIAVAVLMPPSCCRRVDAAVLLPPCCCRLLLPPGHSVLLRRPRSSRLSGYTQRRTRTLAVTPPLSAKTYQHARRQSQEAQ